MNSSKAHVLIVEDNEAALFAYSQGLTKAGYSIITAATLLLAKDYIQDTGIDLMLLDLSLPDGNALELIPFARQMNPHMPVIVITGTADISIAVTAMKLGAENFLTKPANLDTIEAAVSKALEVEKLRRKVIAVQRMSHSTAAFFGTHEKMNKVIDLALIASQNDSVVLITGETGTGKGVLARWIHQNSLRNAEPFVELNCSTLGGDLLRSELFGHSKGAFTSAVKEREGLIEVAHKGTLFLDEIGDMDLDVQAQLLKTIEERTFRRVGENSVRKSNFRLICATNQDLHTSCKNEKFRLDLYYRICVFPIEMPALREYNGDIIELSSAILRSFGYIDTVLPESVQQLLQSYTWPGNIRELRNALERAILLSKGEPLALHHFYFLQPLHVQGSNGNVSTLLSEKSFQNLRSVEKAHIIDTLQACQGDKVKASRMLGISIATLYRKISQTHSKT